MIIGLAAMLIVAFILAVGWWHEVNSNKKLKQQLESAQAEIEQLTIELNKSDATEDPEQEVGHFVVRRLMRKATSETYRNVFDLNVNGQRILEDLTGRFCRVSYVQGGHDAERESCYRAGQSSVVNLILAKISQANDPNYKEEMNDA